MIPVLFKKNEQQFRTYGLGEITDIINPKVTRERNGQYLLYFQYPQNAELSDVFEEDMRIKSDAGVRTKWQTFEISRVIRKEGQLIEVFAKHISQSLLKDALNPSVIVRTSTAQQALNIWNNNRIGDENFDVWSDISTISSTSWNIRDISNAFEALAGVQGSILDVWGGEYEFDNKMIRLHKEMGRNSPVPLEYGRNITGLEQDQQDDNVYTSVYPFATYIPESGSEPETVTLPERYVDGKYLEMYNKRKIQVVDFSGEYDIDNPPTVSSLRTIANHYLEANEVGLPHENLKVEYVDLSKTLDYQEFQTMEEVELNDRLPIFYPKFGITNENAKVVVINYDPVKEENISIELGVIGQSFRTVTTGGLGSRVDRVEKQQDATNNYIVNAKGNRIWFETPDENMEHKIGDTWFEKNGPYDRIRVWNGNQWETIIDSEDIDKNAKAIAEQQEDIEQAQATADEAVKQINTAVSNAGFTSLSDSLTGIQSIANSAQNNSVTAVANAQTALNLASSVQSDVASMDLRVDEIEGTLSLKADSQSLDTLTGRVNLAETNIGINAQGLALKANQSTVDTLAGTVQTLGTEFDIVAGQVNSRVWNTDIDTKINHIETEWTQTFNSFNQTVVGIDGRVSSQEQTVSGHTSTIATLRTDVNGKATITQFNTLNSTVNGTVTRVGNAEGKITTIEQNVSGLQTTVASKADKTQITQLNNAIVLKADKTALSSKKDNYTKTITINGNGNTYYPLYFIKGDQSIPRVIRITRRFNDTAPGSIWNPSQPTHPGGLNLEWVGNFGSWGGAEYKAAITSFGEMYTTLLADLGIDHNAQTYAFYLRGGGAQYTISSDQPLDLKVGYSTNDVIFSTYKSSAPRTSVNRSKIDGLVTAQNSQITVLQDSINLKVSKGDVVSQLNIDAGRTLISSSKILLNADTVNISGTAWMSGAVMKNASIDTAQIADLAVTSGKIASLDASKISTGILEGIAINGVTITGSTYIQENPTAGSTHGRWDRRGITLRDATGTMIMDMNIEGLNFHGSGVSHRGTYINNELIDVQKATIYDLDVTGPSVRMYAASFRGNLTVGSSVSGTDAGIVFNGQSPPAARNRMIWAGHGISGDGLYTYFNGWVRLQSEITNTSNITMNSLTTNSLTISNALTLRQLLSLQNTGLQFSGGSLPAPVDRQMWIGYGYDGNGIYVSMGSSWYKHGATISDERLKKNVVETATDSLDAIDSWEFVEFEWKDSVFGSGQQFGLIAQNTSHIANYYDEVDRWEIDTQKLSMMTAHGLQQLSLREENTNKVASQALQATETNEEKIHQLQQELSKANRRIEELESVM